MNAILPFQPKNQQHSTIGSKECRRDTELNKVLMQTLGAVWIRGIELWSNSWLKKYGDDPLESILVNELAGLTQYQIKLGIDFAASQREYEVFPPQPLALVRICREQSRYPGFPNAEDLYTMCTRWKYLDTSKLHPAGLWLMRHAGSDCKKYNLPEKQSRAFFDLNYRALTEFLANGGKLPPIAETKLIEDDAKNGSLEFRENVKMMTEFIEENFTDKKQMFDYLKKMLR